MRPGASGWDDAEVITRPCSPAARVLSSLGAHAAPVSRVHSVLASGLVGCALLGCVLLGCGSASAGGKAKAEADANKDEFAVSGSAWTMDQEGGENADASGAPQSPKTAKSSSGAQSASNKSRAGEAALLGARHDVSLGKGAPTPCKCLAVVVGPTNTPGLSWSSTPPTLDGASQLVIALGSEDVSCDEAASAASYMGYGVEGSNVVVQVEAAKPGRPITHGAIIPKPAAGGQVLIQGSGSVPYGKGPAGEARCTVGTMPKSGATKLPAAKPGATK